MTADVSLLLLITSESEGFIRPRGKTSEGYVQTKFSANYRVTENCGIFGRCSFLRGLEWLFMVKCPRTNTKYTNCLKVQYMKYYHENLEPAFMSRLPPIKGFISAGRWIMWKSEIITTRGRQRNTDVWKKDVPDMSPEPWSGKTKNMHFI